MRRRAVAPTMRECCLLAFPSLNAETCQIFVDASATPALTTSIFSWWITAARIPPDRTTAALAENIHDVWLPPYCPQLKPIERVWRDLKDELAWPQCTDLDAQQAYVVALLQAYDAPSLLALTGDAYLVGPINALCS